MKTSNNPPVVLELDSEIVDFLVENCEANISLALRILDNRSSSRETLEKVVNMTEKFKKLRGHHQGGERGMRPFWYDPVSGCTLESRHTIMPKVVRVLCAADGSPTPHDGRYVVDWNAHTKAGVIDISTTGLIDCARRFENNDEFVEWGTISNVQAKRPWDGKPNRPLTALSVESLPV
jgi:hypothetical protein